MLCAGSVAVLHATVHHRVVKYFANVLLDMDGLLGIFRRLEVVKVSKVDAFGSVLRPSSARKVT
jgi:hypothetical protein